MAPAIQKGKPHFCSQFVSLLSLESTPGPIPETPSLWSGTQWFLEMPARQDTLAVQGRAKKS